MSSRIAELFFRAMDLTAFTNLHTFVRIPKFNEVDTSNIYFRLWRDYPKIKTFAPRTNRATGMIESVEFSSTTPFIENDWGIMEPDRGETAAPERMDVVLVPLLCFDSEGHRVGYGKGYYDRFLSSCRPDCLKVGLSFFPPVERMEGVHDGDVRLDMCVLPGEIHRPPGGGVPIDFTDGRPS